jgi:hypothetical protein
MSREGIAGVVRLRAFSASLTMTHLWVRRRQFARDDFASSPVRQGRFREFGRDDFVDTFG